MIQTQEFMRGLAALAKPIDFDDLQEVGLLVKGKNGWWEVPDIHALPYDVRVKVEKISTPDHPCNCPGKRIRVKFCPPSAIKKAQELLERLRPVNESSPF